MHRQCSLEAFQKRLASVHVCAEPAPGPLHLPTAPPWPPRRSLGHVIPAFTTHECQARPIHRNRPRTLRGRGEALTPVPAHRPHSCSRNGSCASQPHRPSSLWFTGTLGEAGWTMRCHDPHLTEREREEQTGARPATPQQPTLVGPEDEMLLSLGAEVAWPMSAHLAHMSSQGA